LTNLRNSCALTCNVFQFAVHDNHSLTSALGVVQRMSRLVWNLGDGPEQLSYAATSSFGV
jgi:hypothetical protein